MLHLFYSKFLHIDYFGLFFNFAVSEFKIMDSADQIKKIRLISPRCN
jgi:hypothetical protein